MKIKFPEVGTLLGLSAYDVDPRDPSGRGYHLMYVGIVLSKKRIYWMERRNCTIFENSALDQDYDRPVTVEYESLSEFLREEKSITVLASIDKKGETNVE